MSRLTVLDEDFILRWKYRYGIPPEPYARYQKEYFREMIEELDLKPFNVKIDVLPPDTVRIAKSVTVPTEVNKEVVYKKIQFPGGIIGPHIHFDGKIYTLDKRQWKKFTAGLIEVFKKRLEKIETVDLPQFAKLNEMMTGL